MKRSLSLYYNRVFCLLIYNFKLLVHKIISFLVHNYFLFLLFSMNYSLKLCDRYRFISQSPSKNPF